MGDWIAGEDETWSQTTAQAFTIDGQPIFVEVREPELDTDEVRRFAAEEERAPRDIGEAIDRALPAAALLMRKIAALPNRPSEIEVKFGLKLSGKMGALIASTSVEGNFEVTLTWTAPKPSGDA